MAQTNVSVVINNFYSSNEPSKGQKIYSVVVSHEAEVHENYLYTDKAKAIAKMEKVIQGWIDTDIKREKSIYDRNDFGVYRYTDDISKRAEFTPQYKTKLGAWYENGEWEYGYVEILECVLE